MSIEKTPQSFISTGTHFRKMDGFERVDKGNENSGELFKYVAVELFIVFG